MEDLDNETLTQVGTPKKQGLEGLAAARKVSVRASARDDSDIVRKTKTGGAKGGKAAEQEEVESRQMFDKRELRRRHKDRFDEQLQLWRARSLTDALTKPGQDVSQTRVRVCVRKRPLFDYERRADEFDVISVRGPEVIVHNCLTKADLRSLFVSHLGFHFTHAFGESVTDEEVYTSCGMPAVQQVLRGGVATLFMFGQTGSGKTHTMEGLLRRGIAQLFESVLGNSSGSSAPPVVSITAYEIAGKNIRDLLDYSGTPKDVKIMEDKDKRTHVIGADMRDVKSPEELMQYITNAQARRTTRATQANDTSSRSHAVYRIWLDAALARNPAVLTLVDCAGSERREDSSHHDAQSRKDAAEINSTIFALKECFRVMRSSKSNQQPPYRESLLTRVLSDSFSSDQALIVAFGTVSPSATDTEHSIGTLRSLQQLAGATQNSFEEREDVPKVKDSAPPSVKQWSEDDVRQWLDIAAGGRARGFAPTLSRGTDGKNLLRWPAVRFTQLCGGNAELGDALFQDLRLRIRAGG